MRGNSRQMFPRGRKKAPRGSRLLRKKGETPHNRIGLGLGLGLLEKRTYPRGGLGFTIGFTYGYPRVRGLR